MPRSAAPTAFAGGGSEPSWWEHTQHGGPQAWASWDPRGLWLSLFRSAERLCNKGGRRKGQESRRQRASFGDRGIRTATSVSEERGLGEHWTNLDPRHVSYFLPQPRPQLLGPFRSWARLPCPRPPLQPVTRVPAHSASGSSSSPTAPAHLHCRGRAPARVLPRRGGCLLAALLTRRPL